MAEAAAFNGGLQAVLIGPVRSALDRLSSAAGSISNEFEELERFLQESPEQSEHAVREAISHLMALADAERLLAEGTEGHYDAALRLLPTASLAVWTDLLEDGAAEPNSSDLLAFIVDGQRPLWSRVASEAAHFQARRQQTLGDGYRAGVFEPLCRYEGHLDRKIERTLALLLRLREIRRNQSVS